MKTKEIDKILNNEINRIEKLKVKNWERRLEVNNIKGLREIITHNDALEIQQLHTKWIKRLLCCE